MTNSRRTATFEFQLGDLPMMAHAMMIERNTEIMSGRKIAAARADAIAKQIDACAPDIARIFDEGVFCELCAALAEAPEWAVSIKKARFRTWEHSPGQIAVEIGAKTFLSDEATYTDASPQVELLRAFLDEVSPVADRALNMDAMPGSTP